MKNILFTLVAVLLSLSGAALAAVSGTTQVTYVEGYKGKSPIVATISGTLTSTASPQLSFPDSAYPVGTVSCQRKTATNQVVPFAFFVSGTDVHVSTSPLTSGTLAVGDVINCIGIYPRSL